MSRFKLHVHDMGRGLGVNHGVPTDPGGIHRPCDSEDSSPSGRCKWWIRCKELKWSECHRCWPQTSANFLVIFHCGLLRFLWSFLLFWLETTTAILVTFCDFWTSDLVLRWTVAPSNAFLFNLATLESYWDFQHAPSMESRYSRYLLALWSLKLLRKRRIISFPP